MTQATSGWGAPQTPVTPPAGGGGKPRRRTSPLVVILAGVVAFAAAGVGTFVLSGGFGKVGQSVECGGVNNCIPSITGTDVVAALEAEGYECETNPSGAANFCNTVIGANLYETQLTMSPGDREAIESVTGTVTYPDADPPSGVTKAYLTWLGSLPFSNDEITVGEVTAWLNQRIDDGQNEVVVIGGYQLAVDASQPGKVTFNLRGV